MVKKALLSFVTAVLFMSCQATTPKQGIVPADDGNSLSEKIKIVESRLKPQKLALMQVYSQYQEVSRSGDEDRIKSLEEQLDRLDAELTYATDSLMKEYVFGTPFVDLEMNDFQDNTVKLSQWVGKGNYVLLDFWASWCGPCRAEMPNVVSNYAKYHDEGFEIVGISFDNNASAWKKAVKTLGMKWPQMSDLQGWYSAGAKAYGVNSIPASFLLDGEGKVVGVNLRGDKLGETLREIYGF